MREARQSASPRVPVEEQGGKGVAFSKEAAAVVTARRVKASRYGLSRRTRTTDVEAESSVITRLIGRRRDETAASVLSTAARDGRNARALEREKEGEKGSFSYLFVYRRAIRCRRCRPRLQPEYSGVCEGGDRGRKKEGMYTLYRQRRI